MSSSFGWRFYLWALLLRWYVLSKYGFQSRGPYSGPMVADVGSRARGRAPSLHYKIQKTISAPSEVSLPPDRAHEHQEACQKYKEQGVPDHDWPQRELKADRTIYLRNISVSPYNRKPFTWIPRACKMLAQNLLKQPNNPCSCIL